MTAPTREPEDTEAVWAVSREFDKPKKGEHGLKIHRLCAEVVKLRATLAAVEAERDGWKHEHTLAARRLKEARQQLAAAHEVTEEMVERALMQFMDSEDAGVGLRGSLRDALRAALAPTEGTNDE